MTLEAQGRSDPHNDTLHLYEDDARTPLCSNWQPRRPQIDPICQISDEEAHGTEYLNHDGEVVGKICGKCQNVMRMSSDYDV